MPPPPCLRVICAEGAGQKCATWLTGSISKVSSPSATIGSACTISLRLVFGVDVEEQHDPGVVADLEQMLRDDAMPHEVPRR